MNSNRRVSAVPCPEAKLRVLALAALLGAGFWLASPKAFAGGGDDHSHAGEPKATVSVAAGDAPVRLPDGSLHLPKPVQRQWALRTTLVETAKLSATVEFNGRVIADPGSSGRIQATQAGRVVVGDKGLPTLGQKVRKGEVIAYLQPVANSMERGGLSAEVADLTAQLALAEKRVVRVKQLDGVLPQKEIEAAEIERDALIQRRAAVSRGLDGREALLAPVSGVIGAANVVAGEVVDAQVVLFEVVDPDRLAVEALAYDAADTAGLGVASAAFQGGSASLAFVGAGRVLREQAIPLLFRVTKSKVPLAIGMPVKVIARTAREIEGMAVPQSAVVRNGAGETVVWAKADAERFVARRVRVQPLDATHVAVISGLQQHDRVVVDGATLLSQVR
jgi:hypothetical protein